MGQETDVGSGGHWSVRERVKYQQIADILNMRGERTRYGKPWTDVAVLRTCRRRGLEASR